MANLAKPFERSEFKVAQIDATDNYGKFVIEPLERGYGLTIGRISGHRDVLYRICGCRMDWCRQTVVPG